MHYIVPAFSAFRLEGSLAVAISAPLTRFLPPPLTANRRLISEAKEPPPSSFTGVTAGVLYGVDVASGGGRLRGSAAARSFSGGGFGGRQREARVGGHGLTGDTGGDNGVSSSINTV